MASVKLIKIQLTFSEVNLQNVPKVTKWQKSSSFKSMAKIMVFSCTESFKKVLNNTIRSTYFFCSFLNTVNKYWGKMDKIKHLKRFLVGGHLIINHTSLVSIQKPLFNNLQW